MSDELIRMEDLTPEMIGLVASGRNLTSVEEELLDKYITKKQFDDLVYTLDEIHNSIVQQLEEEESTDQTALYTLFQSYKASHLARSFKTIVERYSTSSLYSIWLKRDKPK
mgnify:CR=1 FL=1